MTIPANNLELVGWRVAESLTEIHTSPRAIHEKADGSRVEMSGAEAADAHFVEAYANHASRVYIPIT